MGWRHRPQDAAKGQTRTPTYGDSWPRRSQAQTNRDKRRPDGPSRQPRHRERPRMGSLRTRAGSRRRGRNPHARHWRRRVGSGRRKAPGRRRATREGGTPESWPRPVPHRRTHACAPQGTKARPQCARPGRRTRDEPWPMRPRGPRRPALPSRRRETRSRARGQQSAGQQTHRTRRARRTRRMSPTSHVPRRHARQAGTASRAQGSQASCRQQGSPRPNGPRAQGCAGHRRERGHRTARR